MCFVLFAHAPSTVPAVHPSLCLVWVFQCPLTWPDPTYDPTLPGSIGRPHPQYNATVLVPDSSGPERYALLPSTFNISNSVKLFSKSCEKYKPSLLAVINWKFKLLANINVLTNFLFLVSYLHLLILRIICHLLQLFRNTYEQLYDN